MSDHIQNESFLLERRRRHHHAVAGAGKMPENLMDQAAKMVLAPL